MLRKIEAKQIVWSVLKSKNKADAMGVGLRIDSPNTLLKFSDNDDL